MVTPGLTNEVIVLQFPSLSRYEQLAHGIFTRHGGVSQAPYDTLNTSYDTDDRPECVRENLKIIKKSIGAEHLRFMNQVHGKNILVLHQDSLTRFRKTTKADAMITDMPGLALMVKQADCQAIIIFDPIKNVVANVHCGWRGNTYDILGSVVKRMSLDFGSKASDLIAAIGPSLGPCCAEFIDYKQIFPEEFKRFMVGDNYFDLLQISRWQLMEAGLKEENIEVSNICTRCRTDLFYSYRAEGITGRFTTVTMLKNKGYSN